MTFSTNPTPVINYVNSVANHLTDRGYSIRIDALFLTRSNEEKWTVSFLVAARGETKDIASISLSFGEEVEEQGMSAVVAGSQVSFKRDIGDGSYKYESSNYDTTAARRALKQGIVAVTGGYGPGVVSDGDMADIIVETTEMGGLAAEDLDF